METIKEKSMKSIREKSEEYHIKVRTINKQMSLVDTQGSEMFIIGANYVLDAIQTYVITEHYNLEYIIEQLKK